MESVFFKQNIVKQDMLVDCNEGGETPTGTARASCSGNQLFQTILLVIKGESTRLLIEFNRLTDY